MKIRPTRELMLSLESIAMTDMVLNMFIFFFISFSLLYTFSPSRVAKFDIKLPGASSAAILQEEGPLVVTITHTGRYYVGERAVSFEALRQALQAARAVSGNRPVVVVRADAFASVKDVVRVFDLARTLGFERLAIGVEDVARAARRGGS